MAKDYIYRLVCRRPPLLTPKVSVTVFIFDSTVIWFLYDYMTRRRDVT